MQLIPVLLCGGSGSRLWPVSREQHPKPFIRLQNGNSLLQNAYILGASLPKVAEVMVVTNSDFFFKVEEELNAVNKKSIPISYIIEPFGRNTAAAIAAATLKIQQKYGDNALVIVLAADHVINAPDNFKQAVDRALPLAQADNIVTFGITPDCPNTGFGYIEAAEEKVLRFIEKPTFEKAKEYLQSGNFLWNSGMFLFTVQTMTEALHTHCPEIFTAIKNCLQKSLLPVEKNLTTTELDADSFALTPNISIDYAVIEKSNNIAVIACEIEWSDIGSWSALAEFIEPDNAGNRLEANTVLEDVKNCYIQSSRLVAAVGIDNLLIVDTPDALLVADKSRDQDVKRLYSTLKTQGHDAHKLHRTVHRPWGTYTVLEESQHFKIKRIEVKPGASLSLQMHHHRSEHWIVVSGIAKVLNDEKEFFVRINESTYIKAGCKHRLENPGSLTLVMIEVQTGDYLGEDDIIRFEDVYGRVKS